MAEPRVVLDVRLTLHRVDRAVARGDRARRRLPLADPHLVAPVDPLHVRAVGALEPELAADVPDLRIGEVAGEQPQRVRLPFAVRVRERHDLARRPAHGSVLGRDLALARALQQLHARVLGCDLADDPVREVGRTVRRDDDLEPVLRVVESERVLDPPPDDRLLVVRGDHEGDGRRLVGLPYGPWPNAREHAHRERVPGVRPRQGAQRAPEQRPRDHAASNSRTSARYRSMATTRSASSST